MRLTDVFKTELIKFCADNGMDYQKVLNMRMCGNEDILFIQYYDKENASKFIDDSKPAEILLELKRLADGTVTIQKGKKAEFYLT